MSFAWPWALARTLLLACFVPAIIWDRDGRGLHDRAAGALTLRAGRVNRPVGSGARSVAVPPAATRAPKPAATKPTARRRKKRR